MVSNVSNYVAGFDESGKRIGSIIFDGDPASEKDVAAEGNFPGCCCCGSDFRR